MYWNELCELYLTKYLPHFTTLKILMAWSLLTGVNISTQKRKLFPNNFLKTEYFSQENFYNLPEESSINDNSSNFNFIKPPSLLFWPIYALKITKYSHLNPLPLPLDLKVAPNNQSIELICNLPKQFLSLLVFYTNKFRNFSKIFDFTKLFPNLSSCIM